MPHKQTTKWSTTQQSVAVEVVLANEEQKYRMEAAQMVAVMNVAHLAKRFEIGHF